MAYDSVRRRVVLYGGSAGRDETWEYDGDNWILRTPASNPGSRSDHVMAYDEARRLVVLFAGASTNDTWVWDGDNWTRREPSARPPERNSSAMAYDPRRQRIVLFGGSGASGALNDTWEWDGSNWAQRFPTSIPAPRLLHAMAYDPGRGRIVLYGGWDGNSSSLPYQDTWEWDGSNWLQRAPVSSPHPRANHAMATDPSGTGVLLFGGATTAGGMDDTWLYSGDFRTSFYTTFGEGCRGTMGTPALLPGLPPAVGSPFSLVFTQLPLNSAGVVVWGFSRDSWGPVRLPVNLTPLGFPGCTLYTEIVFSFGPFNTGLYGAAVWGMILPNDPSLAGGQFFNQALFVDPAANPGGLVLTNAGAGIVGR